MKRSKNETLKERYDAKNNSFGLISIIGAILIIFYHSYSLFYGVDTTKADFITKFLYSEDLGTIIVAMFFVISGFMITSSIIRSKNIWQYLKKRILKIYPTLILCVLLCSFVMAPIVLKIPFFKYINDPSLYANYISGTLLFWKNSVLGIPNLFINNPYPTALNGSLWTIKPQFFLYLLMIPLYFIFIKNTKNNKYYKYFFWFVFIFTSLTYLGVFDKLFLNFSDVFNSISYIFIQSKNIIRVAYYFFAGVFLNLYSDKIVYNIKLLLPLLIICLFTSSIHWGGGTTVAMLAIPYFTMYLGTFKLKLNIKDISYQIYVFAWPIGQLIMYYGQNKLNYVLYLLISIIITVLVGWIAYYICEVPLKKLKRDSNEKKKIV